MVLLLHILIACTSLIFTTYVFLFPTKRKLHFSYLLAAFTLVSGSYLLISKPTHLVQACFAGLVYFGFISYGIVSVRNKLAKTDAIRSL